MQRLITIDRKLAQIDKKVHLLGRLNPTNSQQECRNFFSAYLRESVYNPIFRYKPLKINFAAVRAKLNEIQIQVPPVKNERWFFATQLEGKKKRISDKLLALEARGTEKFSEHSLKLFGLPIDSQVAYAQKELEKNTPKEFLHIEESVSSRQAAGIFSSYLKKGDLPWKTVLRKNISSKAGLDARSKYLIVKSNAVFSKQEIISLATHEIETHIYRRENGLLQSFPGLFSEGFAGPPTTEEGLAFYNETRYNHDPRRMKIVCARTIAADVASKKSFFETFLTLVKYGIPPAYIWPITLRAKRGFVNTATPGSFGKDHHYLKGYLEVKNYFSTGGKIDHLYVGKINLNNMEAIHSLGIVTQKPKYLPIYFNKI